MNSLKYIFYFLLGFIIYKIINYKVEGFSNNSFILLSRIIGLDNLNDPKSVRTQYSGCQNYECDNGINSTDNYVDKKFNNDLNYLTCNNEHNYSPTTLLGSNRCDHDKCCFNTKCSSTDVQSLPLLDKDENDGCLKEEMLKKDAHCNSKADCENNFRIYCCSKEINEDSPIRNLFSEININSNDINENKLLSKPELETMFANEGIAGLDTSLVKLLTDAEVKLNIYDLNDLV